MHRGSAGASPSQEGGTVPRPEESDGRVSIPSDAPGQGEVSAQDKARNISESTNSSTAGQMRAIQQTEDTGNHLVQEGGGDDWGFSLAQGGGEVQIEDFRGKPARPGDRRRSPTHRSSRSDNPLGSDTLIDLSDDETDSSSTRSNQWTIFRWRNSEATNRKLATRIQAKELASMMQRLGKGIEDSYQGIPDLCWSQVREDLVGLEYNDEEAATGLWHNISEECRMVAEQLETEGIHRGELALVNLPRAVEMLVYFWRQKGQEETAQDLQIMEQNLLDALSQRVQDHYAAQEHEEEEPFGQLSR